MSLFGVLTSIIEFKQKSSGVGKKDFGGFYNVNTIRERERLG